MTKEEAKFILSALCNNEKERFDPGVTEALRMAENDEELGNWFADLLEFDGMMSEELGNIPIPPELEGNILTGLKVSQKSNRKRRVFLGALAAAALVAVGLFVAQVMNFTNRSSEELAQFHRDMLGQIEQLTGIDHVSSDPRSVAAWFESREVHPGCSIPAAINGGNLIGCTVLDWKSREVCLICFSDPSGEGPGVHLMTMDAAAFQRLTDGEEDRIDGGEWSSTVWRCGDKVHLVAVKGAGGKNPREFFPLS